MRRGSSRCTVISTFLNDDSPRTRQHRCEMMRRDSPHRNAMRTERTHRPPVGVVFVVLLLAAAHLALGRAHDHARGADDDRLYFYFTGVALTNPVEANALQQRVVASMRAHGRSDDQVLRFEVRNERQLNYVGASAVSRLSSAVAGVGSDATLDYPTHVAPALLAGLFAMYAITACAVLAIARRCGPRLALAVGLSLAITGLLTAVFGFIGGGLAGRQRLLPLYGDDQLVRAVLWFAANTIGLIVNPRIGFTLFGDTPRNHFILATIAVFVLRWSGRHRGAAALLLGLSFLHQSMAGLVVIGLIACDAVLRPEIFARRDVRALYAGTLMLTLTREALGPHLLPRYPILVAVALAALVWWAAPRTPAFGSPAWLAAVGERLRRCPEPWPDVLFLFALWLMTVPPAALINAFAGATASFYFWTELHGRLLATLRPVLILAVCVTLVDRLAILERPARAWCLATVCALALTPGLWRAASYSWAPVERLRAALLAIDAEVGPRLDWGQIGRRTEAEIYYALARSMEGRERDQDD
jgi:hypothetical protein